MATLRLNPRRHAPPFLALLLTVAAAGQRPNARGVPRDVPLSSVVAVTLPREPVAPTIPAAVRHRVDQYARGALPPGVRFPITNPRAPGFRTASDLRHDVVVSWLDPLTDDESPEAPRFGANCDYTAWFGQGWQSDWVDGAVGAAPQFNGDPRKGLLWVNHEYVSNLPPTARSAPTGQGLTLARFLKAMRVLDNDVEAHVWKQTDLDRYDAWHKRQLGGSLIRIEQGDDHRWRLVRTAANVRYDATDRTLASIVGYDPRRRDHDAEGSALPPGVVAGLLGDCSGGQTPWGTILTAEENVQDFYGDLETCWTPLQRFVRGTGFDPGADIRPTVPASRAGLFGRTGVPDHRHDRDHYGFIVEVDPTSPPDRFYRGLRAKGDGRGHRKLGGMGRARWENATVAVDADSRLTPGQPIVIYGGNDRRGGRIYRFVSKRNYTTGMTTAEVRGLLDEGTLYVAHFAGLHHATGITMHATDRPPTRAEPGRGVWLELSVASEDLAPNAQALKRPGTTVGAALKDRSYNGIGGFPTDNDVLAALFTAASKIGVAELNRPEDIEWNANDPSGTPTLYVALSKHELPVALDQDGVMFDPRRQPELSPRRTDIAGSIFALVESKPRDLRNSKEFAFFIAWRGSLGQGPFDAANPDNLLLDQHGGLWFATDGNYATNRTADAVYYLDLDPAHRAGRPGVSTPTYGKPFRVAAMPLGAEATGPSFNSDASTMFVSVQHPGEILTDPPSRWPPRK